MPILEDGQLFERYRVHKWVGSGVAGESYEAEDRILQRKVTLKLIHPWATLSDSARRQFFREMQGISLLNHPYLATVLDYGEIDGRIYVARRYVSSGSLLGTNGRLWFHPPLPVADAFTYAHQLAQVLQYIHQHGYVHGSLAFANVLVLRGPNTETTSEYAPFLMADIGLAHFVRRFGNPRLETLPISAAPEQLNKRVLPASDQFALAVLLYFWLAGRPPYLGASYEIEQQKRTETITPLSTLNPGVNLEQDGLILRALRAYPENRHPSVLAFAEALLASLTPTSQYTPTNGAPLPSAETPRERLHLTGGEQLPAEPAAEAQAVSQPQAPASSTTETTRVAPAQSKAEPRRSALEELLASSQTSSEQSANEYETQVQPEEPPIEMQQPEYPGFLPRLPETPRVEEHILQADLARLTLADEASTLPPPRHTGPLAVEPADSTTSQQTSEPAGSTISESVQSPPAAQEDDVSANALPVISEESASDQPSGEIPSTGSIEEVSAALPDAAASFTPTEATITDPGKETEISSGHKEDASISVSATGKDIDTGTEESVSPADGEAIPGEEAEMPPPVAEFSSSGEGATDVPSADISTSVPIEYTPVSLPYEAAPDSEIESTGTPQEEFLSASNESASLFTPVKAAEEPGVSTLPLEELALAEEAELDDDESLGTVPLVESAQAVSENAVEASQVEASPDEAKATETPVELEVQDKNLEEPPTVQLKELSSASIENTNPNQSEQAANIAEMAPAGEENALQALPAEISPSTTDERASSGEEGASPTAAAEISSPNEAIPAESEAVIDSPTSQPALEVARSQEFDLSAPPRESLESTGATYSPIDEAIAVPRLIISSPYTSSSFEFLIMDEEINVGRAGSSNLYLEQDNLTSRHHALLKRIGERVLIFDKRSHNGVFLNGQKIDVGRGYELADGDHIGIGNYELIFRSASTGQISQLI